MLRASKRSRSCLALALRRPCLSDRQPALAPLDRTEIRVGKVINSAQRFFHGAAQLRAQNLKKFHHRRGADCVGKQSEVKAPQAGNLQSIWYGAGVTLSHAQTCKMSLESKCMNMKRNRGWFWFECCRFRCVYQTILCFFPTSQYQDHQELACQSKWPTNVACAAIPT